MNPPLLVDPLLPTCRAALSAAQAHADAARAAVAARIAPGGAVDAARLDEHQFAAHGYAWTATYVAALRQLLAWAEREHPLGELEALILQAGFGEYLAQLSPGSRCRRARSRGRPISGSTPARWPTMRPRSA